MCLITTIAGSYPAIPTMERYANYKNRYRDSIMFEIDEKNPKRVFMTGFNPLGLRVGFEESPDNPNMVDPSGGPYLTIGADLRMFYGKEDKAPMLITGFTVEDTKIIITIE